MQNVRPEESGRRVVGGIKVSAELVQFNLLCSGPDERGGLPLLHRMAEDGINIGFLTRTRTENGFACCFCVTANDAGKVRSLVKETTSGQNRIDVIAPVGTVLIYPHRNDPALIGTIIRVFGAARIPVRALCTSLSAIAVTIDYHLVDRAVTEIQRFFDLPENHAPFHPEPEAVRTVR